MIKRFFGLLAKDTKITFRNHYYTIVIALAVMYIVAVNFFIPADFSIKPKVFILNETGSDQVLYVVGEDERDKLTIVNSEEELHSKLNEKTNRLGIIARNANGTPNIELIFQGSENVKVRNLLAAMFYDRLGKIYSGVEDSFEVEVLKPDLVVNHPAFNKAMIPVFVFSEAAMLGLLLIVTLVFAEKSEGTIRAYNVTPGGIIEYLLSKNLAMTFVSLVFTVLLVVFTLGFSVDFLYLFIVIILASFFASTLGLLIASFFQNLSQFIYWGLLVVIVATLPAAAYFVPAFAPFFIRWLPTYHLVFTLKEIFFSTGNVGVIYSGSFALLCADVILFTLTVYAYKKRFKQV
ncbi:MAG: ABC transporter permease [Halanaerobiales bacterium]|nr:ABC transporter permease [Halanaerobiales bacterium]